MPDRDWEKELADIDRRINAAPEPAASAPAPAAPPRRAAAPERPSVIGGTPPIVATPRRTWKTNAGLAFRLVLAGVLLACIVVWPYETRCGVGLGAYLATLAVTALAAVWTSVAAWKHRSATLHVLGLAMVVATSVYAAREILPRVGYALPDPNHPTIWTCQ